MQSGLSDYIVWAKTVAHSKPFLVTVLVFLFFCWKFLLNSPTWVLGKMLAVFYKPVRLAAKIEIAPDPRDPHLMLTDQAGSYPAIENIRFKIINTLRFVAIEIRRAEVEFWIYNQFFISRDRFLGEVVKSSRPHVLDFSHIDLDGARLKRLEASFGGKRPDSLTLSVNLKLQCSTFFNRFDVKKTVEYIVKIY